MNESGGNDLWRGMATVAGSWIGGGANQAAMKEIYKPSDNLFATMIVVDVFVANIWMGVVLYGASISNHIDTWFRADNSAIEQLKQKLNEYQAQTIRIPNTTDIFQILAAAFGATALAHYGSDLLTPFMQGYIDTLTQLKLTTLADSFFWLVVLATTLGVALSFTSLRNLEGVGASRIGSVCIYILVATIGMKMDLGEVAKNWGVISLGLIWMLVHIVILLVTAFIIRAPFFFVAVGSQANIGGAASAPIVASAFHPALAPVGALLAVLGYALGTYGALICAEQMSQIVKP
jgi:uncharacterized membrane protein